MTTTFPRTMGYGLGTSLQRGASAFGPWVTSDPYDYPLRDQSTAPSFPPFKFEPRRARIDWRLLHGIDINTMIRDVDLDTLEKIVNIVAFGDIEAEDTRHLTELNFIKIFRLSQMMIEYLLYVQDCLQNSNAWLQQDRANMDKYVQAARLRIRELEANLKMNKRELRRTRKTIKTYELLAVLNDGKGTGTVTMTAAAAAPPSPPPAPPPPPQPQVVKSDPNPISLAMEALLRKELSVLGERLGKATLECQTLRSERDELFQAVKDLEATVKAKSQLSGTSSPLAYSRQNAEALQTIQGLQDQLNRATVEIAKLRNEKGELSEELERANVERRQLQDEKSRLLSELASRPTESPTGVDENVRGSENLGSMLLEADRQKAALQDQLADAKAEIAQLQKELMKAMKATAFGTLPPPQAPDDRALRELEAATAQLEKELAKLRRTYYEDVRQLQKDLETTRARAVEADRRLAELRERETTARSSPAATGGFVKVVEERRPSPDDEDHGADRQRALLAEYEATNERLNEQLIQLKGERSTLAAEVEQLRLRLQNRPSPSQADKDIDRGWRMEEMERLKEECDAAHRRNLDLEAAMREREAFIEQLLDKIHRLQAELDESRLQQEAALEEAGASRVKQQVQHFERLADPSKPAPSLPLKPQTSFSFAGDSPPGSGVPETPTSLRRAPHPAPDLPPSPPLSKHPGRITSSSLPPSIPEEAEQPPASLVPPSLNEQPGPGQPGPGQPGPGRPGMPPNASQGPRSLQRINRPTPEQKMAILQTTTWRVKGRGVQEMNENLKDTRDITESPYEYVDDEEARFRAMMPHEVPGRRGVRSVEPHELEDLATARSLYTDQLMAVVDDTLAQFGLEPEECGERLDDRTYLACMEELKARRERLLGEYPKRLQERAVDLREWLLTHLELVKRDHLLEARLKKQQELEQHLLEQRRQQQRQDVWTGAGKASEEDELEPGREGRSGSGASGSRPSPASAEAAVPFTVAPQLARNEPAAGTASVTLSQGLAAAAAVASRPLATGAAEAGAAVGGASAAAAAAGGPQAARQQMPTFPSRQTSLQRSSRPPGDTVSEHPSATLPPAPAAAASRPASDTNQKMGASARGTPTQGRSASTTPASREASITELHSDTSQADAGRASGASAAVTPLRRSASDDSNDSASDPRQRSMRSGQSLPRSATSARSQPATGPSSTTARPSAPSGSSQPAVPTPVVLRREVSAPGSPERVTLGPARPTSVARPGPAAQPSATAAGSGGNMNMSIRSVKYQDSDLDDDEDDVPLPQPKPVRRLADEDDEYTLTEDEEAQQDMGIEDIDDFSGGARQPKILMAGSPQRPPGPSRLGMQPTPATTQARGWATSEPLQPAPEKPRASQPASETTGEVEMLESIQSFDNVQSQSMKRSPGAWGSPSGTMRKPAAQPSTQLSVASKQSGWNEAITSFGGHSGAADEVQAIQDFTESFNESTRPMGRMMGGQQRGTAAGSSQAAPPQPRTINRRPSYSDDLSEIEYA